MHCFNHTSTTAVGICKACSKGICVDCAVDVQNGIACRDSCEDEVRYLNSLIHQSDNVKSKSEKLLSVASPVGGIMFSLAAGGVFLYLGLTSDKIRAISLLGIIFTGQGLFSAYRYWFKK